MKNFRLISAKCCGTCCELKQDDMSGHYYCGQEEGAKYPTIDFDPQEGEQWRYVCDGWSDPVLNKLKNQRKNYCRTMRGRLTMKRNQARQ